MGIHVLGRAPITSVGAFTTYANGAVVPTDTPAVAAATAQHLAAKGTPILHDTYATVAHVGYAGYPFAHYGHYLGKREAESDAEAYYGVYGLGYGYGLHHVPAVTSVGGLTTYSNGAVVPTDPPPQPTSQARDFTTEATLVKLIRVLGRGFRLKTTQKPIAITHSGLI